MRRHGLISSLLLFALVPVLFACMEAQPPKATFSQRNEEGGARNEERLRVGELRSGMRGKRNEERGNGAVTRMMEVPAPLSDRPEQIIRRKGYTVSYNKQTRQANWVAWHLVKSHTYGRYHRDEQIFTEDMSVPSPRATDADYYSSRYDRGHLCPAADNKWSEDAMEESFLFTNVCPQNHALNKNDWNDLEMECRHWARQYGAIDIVCGPIFYDKKNPVTIGRNRVWVPDAFFKVVLCRQTPFKALGFIYRNHGRTQTMRETVCTIDEVERITGIDFFPMLKDDVETKVEAHCSLSDWK